MKETQLFAIRTVIDWDDFYLHLYGWRTTEDDGLVTETSSSLIVDYYFLSLLILIIF